MWYICLKCGALRLQDVYVNKHEHDGFDYFVKVPDKYICYDFERPSISVLQYKKLIEEVVKPNPVADINLVDITVRKELTEIFDEIHICLQCGGIFDEYSNNIIHHTHNGKYLYEDISKYENFIDITVGTHCTHTQYIEKITEIVSKNPNFDWDTHYKTRYGDSIFDVDTPVFFSPGFITYLIISLTLVSIFAFGIVDDDFAITCFIICSLIFIGVPAWFNFKLYSEYLFDYKLYKRDIKEFKRYRIKMAQERQEQYAATNRGNSLMSSTPKCPICNSTNLSKISNVSKAAKVGAFGILGAGDIGKTWKCNSCGSKF